jgi:hypothetical protein
VCFVGEGIYRSPVDGPLIAGLFCIIPLLAFGRPAVRLDIDLGIAAVAALAGIAYLLHVYFYFRALFLLNDGCNAEIFNTLSVLVVPVLAFVLIGEVLEPTHYAALGISITAILVLVAGQLSTLNWKIMLHLAAAVVLVSLSMVLQAWVLQFISYQSAVALFSAAAFFGAVALLGVQPQLRRRTIRLCGRFGLLFAGVQILELVAVLGSQRATDIGPSVSLVALLECSLPVFLMGFSWMLFALSRRIRLIDSDKIRSALSSQTTAYPAKLLSLALIVSAIGLVQLG